MLHFPHVKRCIPLILALLLMTSHASPFASERGSAGHFFERVTGKYIGTVMDGGQIVEQVTEFRTGKDGRPVASYTVRHPDGTRYTGTFENAYLVGPRTLTFVWQDRHGQGVVMIEFTPDLASFDGNWGIDQIMAINTVRGMRK